MNHLNTIIQNVKLDNERKNQFFESVVNHIDIGLIAFDENGKIELYNRAAKMYLIAQQPRQLSSLESLNSDLCYIINTVRPGQELLHKIKKANHVQNVLIKATELKFENNIIKLVSFQDITNELDKKELDSWQKLIRVLTHEIMNSISPITSLTSVISGYFKNKDNAEPVMPEKINQNIINKTISGLNTIEETGKGLLEFVDKYRSFTSLPKPTPNKFAVDSLFQHCKLLMESELPNNIKIITNAYPQNIDLLADYAQVEQILINLIKNAIEAINNKIDGTITLKAFHGDEATIIQVEDNGSGISGDIIENIFVPFFTTKENGSGIGLSLSKQIMQNHNGAISVNSSPNEGTTFTLNFQ
jgi:nitrogen fixation/metabolism regulation signal transduction histidine kinase